MDASVGNVGFRVLPKRRFDMWSWTTFWLMGDYSSSWATAAPKVDKLWVYVSLGILSEAGVARLHFKMKKNVGMFTWVFDLESNKPTLVKLILIHKNDLKLTKSRQDCAGSLQGGKVLCVVTYAAGEVRMCDKNKGHGRRIIKRWTDKWKTKNIFFYYFILLPATSLFFTFSSFCGVFFNLIHGGRAWRGLRLKFNFQPIICQKTLWLLPGKVEVLIRMLRVW